MSHQATGNAIPPRSRFLSSSARRTDVAHAPDNLAARSLSAAATTCFSVLVAGQLVFAAYVVLFYGRAAMHGRLEDWNKVLPNGYVPGATLMNLMLGLHLALAVVIFVGGALQLLSPLRRRWPRFHRWNGRIYLATALVLSVGGTTMVWGRGAVGDLTQHVAITVNALLILVFGGFALREALARRFDAHRRWALRLYLAVAGVWFFRIGLMLWILVNRGPAGFDPDTFSGPALSTLAFAQYLLPLAVLEGYFRVKATAAAAPRIVMTAVLALLSLAVVAGIAAASMMLWLPRVS
ncbi:MAG: DUF2306 domain-containing protein [Rhodanobacteraceae bacterium]|nr:DUF2306 domain-containing protein [Rhodanobacteraceae bacterium]